MLRALLLENVHPLATKILSSAGFDVVTAHGALDEAELIAALDGVNLLGIRSKTQISERVIESAHDLLSVGAFCIGTNQIDLGAAARAGVAVFNAPFSNTRSVVELAVAEIIGLTRRLTVRDKALHAGIWDKSANGAHEVRGRTLGIVGYGNIGSQLSVVAEALGMRVVFFDTAEKLALGNAQRMDTLEELLEIADAVTLHVDGRPGNAGIFGARQFAAMKDGAIFLNLSRGFVVDLDALRERIVSGAIVGAAIDVFPQEPKAQGEVFTSPLVGLDNVILTPHVGGSTEEAQENIGVFVASKLRDYVVSGSTSLSVNLPNLALATHGTATLGDGDGDAADLQRIAHLHENVPGVLAEVNQTFAAAGVNIESQVLGTRGDVGYVVTDIASPVDADALEQLAQMPATIRLRVLS